MRKPKGGVGKGNNQVRVTTYTKIQKKRKVEYCMLCRELPRLYNRFQMVSIDGRAGPLPRRTPASNLVRTADARNVLLTPESLNEACEPDKIRCIPSPSQLLLCRVLS